MGRKMNFVDDKQLSHWPIPAGSAVRRQRWLIASWVRTQGDADIPMAGLGPARIPHVDGYASRVPSMITKPAGRVA